MPLGPQRARRALLRAGGLRVVGLPRFAWRAVCGGEGVTREEQLCLLANLLRL